MNAKTIRVAIKVVAPLRSTRGDYYFISKVFVTMTNKKPIKEVKAPKPEVDVDFLHNLVRAEIAVVKAEEEKKAREEAVERKIEYDKKSLHKFRTFCYCLSDSEIRAYCNWKRKINICDKNLPEDIVFYSQSYLEEYKQYYTKRLIRSIISSLWLWATAMFLILNT